MIEVSPRVLALARETLRSGEWNGYPDYARELVRLHGLLTAAPAGADLVEIRIAFDAGFKLGVSYGDNWIHFQGEQADRQFKKYISCRALPRAGGEKPAGVRCFKDSWNNVWVMTSESQGKYFAYERQDYSDAYRCEIEISQARDLIGFNPIRLAEFERLTSKPAAPEPERPKQYCPGCESELIPDELGDHYCCNAKCDYAGDAITEFTRADHLASASPPPAEKQSDPNQPYDEKKMKELILYIASKCKDDPSFDAEKLKAILFKIDFTAYRELGKSITGATYVKEPDPPAEKIALDWQCTKCAARYAEYVNGCPRCAEYGQRAGVRHISEFPPAEKTGPECGVTDSYTTGPLDGKGSGLRFDNCRDWWTILDRLAAQGCQFQLHYDHDYGIDRRRGWTLIVNGTSALQFAESPQAAVMEALIVSAACRGR